MGALIQTKGTIRLANHFCSRFSDLGAARLWESTGAANKTTKGVLPDVFDKNLDLLRISDSFIAQNASAAWPADGNDILYPSATMTAAVASNTNSISFKFSTGFASLPLPTSSMITQGASVISLDKRGSIKNGTKVAGPPTSIANGFAVPLTANVNVTKDEKICFITGNHQRLVRRWRWYLAHDLKPENDSAMKNAISSALDDQDFQAITFQTLEDTQSVLTTTEQQLDPTSFELIDQFVLHIILMTQRTSAPDPQD